MTGITTSLPEERLTKLRELASAYGISPEELVRASIDRLWEGPRKNSREQQTACSRRMKSSTKGSLTALSDLRRSAATPQANH